jgi:hypothetical protein
MATATPIAHAVATIRAASRATTVAVLGSGTYDSTGWRDAATSRALGVGRVVATGLGMAL